MPLEMEICMSIPNDVNIADIFNDPWVAAMLVSRPTEINMRSSYYDTPSLSLSARKWAFRLRKEGGGTIAALKTGEKSSLVRGEWQCEAGSPEEASRLLTDAGAPAELLDYNGFEEICTVGFIRKKAMLKCGELTVELAADEGRITAGGRTKQLRDLELELQSGTLEQLKTLADEFKTRFNLSCEPRSKLERALSLLEAV